MKGKYEELAESSSFNVKRENYLDGLRLLV